MSVSFAAIIGCVILASVVALLVQLRRRQRRREAFSEAEFDVVVHPPVLYRLDSRAGAHQSSLPAPLVFSEAMPTAVVATDYQATEMLLFRSLDDIERIYSQLILPVNVRFVNAFSGIDLLANKATFARFMRGTRVVPDSWVLSDPADVQRLSAEVRPGGLYMLKKNVQEQKGLRIVRQQVSQSVLDEGRAGEYVVAQTLLQDPFLVDDRKINMRVYVVVLVTAGRNGVRFFEFDDGFVYYAAAPWKADAADVAVNVTTGTMADRSVYDSNPLTRRELNEFLGPRRSYKLNASIAAALSTIRAKYADRLGRANAGIPSGVTGFQVFGVDVAPSNTLDVTVMEINKGPDLNYRDARDRTVKLTLARDMLTLVFSNGSTTQDTQFREITA